MSASGKSWTLYRNSRQRPGGGGIEAASGSGAGGGRNRTALENRLEGLVPSRSVEALFERVDTIPAAGVTSDR